MGPEGDPVREQVKHALMDFLGFADEIDREITQEGRSAYLESRVKQLASEALIQKLGESVNRLPEDFRSQRTEVSWGAIRGMRNVVTHQYDQTDHAIIWTAMSDRLPLDAAAVRRILEGL